MSFFARKDKDPIARQAADAAQEVTSASGLSRAVASFYRNVPGNVKSAVIVGLAGACIGTFFSEGLYFFLHNSHQDRQETLNLMQETNVLAGIASSYNPSLQTLPAIPGYRVLAKDEIGDTKNFMALQQTANLKKSSTDFDNQLPALDEFLRTRHLPSVQVKVDAFNNVVKALRQMDGDLAKAVAVNAYVCSKGYSAYKAFWGNHS